MKRKEPHPDWELIQEFGPANLARRLKARIQVIQNWKYRGIPLKVKVAHPQLLARRKAGA